MSRRLRLGRVFDVDVWIDWSWFVAFGVGVVTLLTIAPRMLPSLPPGELAALALLASLGALGALAVHELARAVTARSCGVPVATMTLFLFGSSSDTDRDRASPRVEALAALAAFVASVFAGTACLVGAGLPAGVDELDTKAPSIILLAALGAANLLVAAVNLLPAYPLDGGRLLRAALLALTGDVERSTRWCAWSSELIGWLAVVAGISLVFATHGVAMAAAAWLTLAGWFLASSAVQAYERTFTAGADA